MYKWRDGRFVPVSAGDFIKLLIIIGMQGPHDSIPKSKVESVVPSEILMVHIVVHRGVDPPSDPRPVKSPGVKFIPYVAVDIVDDHEQKEKTDMQNMYGDGKEENGQDASFNDGLERMKGIGCPWRGICGPVMHKVEYPEHLWMMHQPVGPVEISIMHDCHDGENTPEV